MKVVTSGMRNLENEVVVNFQPQTRMKKLTYKKNNIKAVFGGNGSGKSSLIASIDLYRNICLYKNYLLQDANIDNLKQSINKKKNEFRIKVIFAECKDNMSISNIYSHELIIRIANDFPFIHYEKYSKLIDSTINGEYEALFEVVDGEVSFIASKSDLFELFLQRTLNTLRTSSLASSFLDFFAFNFENLKGYSVGNAFLIKSFFSLLILNGSLRVYMEKNEYDRRSQTSKILDMLRKNGIHDINNDLIDNLAISDQDEEVDIQYYEEYLKKIDKLTRFLKVFKPELIKIKIEKRVDKDSYICSKTLCYNGYEVSSSRESTGIMKLMRIFDYLEDITNGAIVFIDELDANLHDVYLQRLLEYIANYASGQLCFTTHNISSMKYLKEYKNSIDFIGEDRLLTSWVKNGNYSPENRYREGMIKGSPFNIESFDFLSVFGTEED